MSGILARCLSHVFPNTGPLVRSHFGSSRDPSSRQVFVCCVHRMAPVACRPIIKCGKSGCTGSCPVPVVEYGFTAWRKPATCRTCWKTFPNVTLSDLLPAKSERKKGNRSRNSSPGMSRRSRNVSPAMSRKSSVVSWSDSPREHSEANGEDTVMEDGTETHQAEIKKKIKANDKLRKNFTNMPEEHRTLIYGDSFKSKMESLDDEKAALLAAKRQFLPLQSPIDKQKNYLERVSREIESKQKKRLEILQKWIEADRKQLTLNRRKPNKRWRCWWLNGLQKNAKTVNQGNPGFQSHMSGHISDQVAQHTILSVFKSVLSMQSMGCHGVSEQLMAAGATEEDVQKISQVVAQTVRTLETGIANPEPRPEAHSLPCEVVGSDEELSNGICIPKWTPKVSEAIKRSVSNAITEKRLLAKKCKQEGEGL